MVQSKLRFTAAVVAVAAFAVTLGPSPSSAAEVSFKDKRIDMIIGYAAGGGTDAAGRLIAQFFSKYLPGSPNVVPRNVPGADGVTALNYMVTQTKPDGMTIAMNSSTQSDPLSYRKANAQYDPSTFEIIGGVGRGGTFLLASVDGEKRLHDKSAPPAIMGSIDALPRSGMQMTAWGIGFLGWNAKWIVGYRGTNDVMLALERHEIDMTSTGNMFQIQKFLQSGDYKIIYQSGILDNGELRERPELPDAPVFPKAMDGKITDPKAKAAFDYWQQINAMDKWVALMPGTPKDIVETYRAAFRKMTADPEFLALGKRMSDDFQPMEQKDVEYLINGLAHTPSDATDYMKTLLRSQGLRVE
jgi:hypothetical protein